MTHDCSGLSIAAKRKPMLQVGLNIFRGLGLNIFRGRKGLGLGVNIFRGKKGLGLGVNIFRGRSRSRSRVSKG